MQTQIFMVHKRHLGLRAPTVLAVGFALTILVGALDVYKRQEQSRFAQLQSQINPHFLFNTLQSVANMAGIEQATVTGDMVVRLANFFRYTLDHDDSVVTLDRELALLRDYISLQELRFGERISFEMNCRCV